MEHKLSGLNKNEANYPKQNVASKSIEMKVRKLLYHLTEMENNLKKWKKKCKK